MTPRQANRAARDTLIVELFCSGKTSTQIAKRVRMCPQNVTRVIRKAGLTGRDGGWALRAVLGAELDAREAARRAMQRRHVWLDKFFPPFPAARPDQHP